jgi:hypothetical protein
MAEELVNELIPNIVGDTIIEKLDKIFNEDEFMIKLNEDFPNTQNKYLYKISDVYKSTFVLPKMYIKRIKDQIVVIHDDNDNIYTNSLNNVLENIIEQIKAVYAKSNDIVRTYFFRYYVSLQTNRNIVNNLLKHVLHENRLYYETQVFNSLTNPTKFISIIDDNIIKYHKDNNTKERFEIEKKFRIASISKNYIFTI